MAAKRKIFEDADDGPGPAPSRGGLIGADDGERGRIRIWLVILFALVAVMILVGGLTRLTDSGLSITEWEPVMGAVPPLSAADWEAAFGKYRQTLEFRTVNPLMTLAEFKTIFWWEWGHRFLGRFIGVVWGAGFLYFMLTRSIPRGWTARLLLPGALGGLQAVVGWLMVASGLDGARTDVAPAWLAAHLGIAFAILAVIAWPAFKLGRSEADLLSARRRGDRRLFGSITGLLHLCGLQILLGALVAGLDAGRNYTDWPLMAGGVLPPGVMELSPWWLNFIENDGTAQFTHRVVGYLTLAFGIWVWLRSRGSGHDAVRSACSWMAAILVGQVVLGIMTVLYGAPLGLAAVHQLGGVALWTSILHSRYLALYPTRQIIGGAAT